MQVNLAPSTVRRERHGVMTGEITRVESYASTRRGMMRALHNESLVDAFMADTASAPIALRALLQLDDRLRVTRVVIAHRLSTIRHADRIIVLERGRITQQGRFEDLLREGGTFATLVRRQIM